MESVLIVKSDVKNYIEDVASPPGIKVLVYARRGSCYAEKRTGDPQVVRFSDQVPTPPHPVHILFIPADPLTLNPALLRDLLHQVEHRTTPDPAPQRSGVKVWDRHRKPMRKRGRSARTYTSSSGCHLPGPGRWWARCDQYPRHLRLTGQRTMHDGLLLLVSVGQFLRNNSDPGFGGRDQGAW